MTSDPPNDDLEQILDDYEARRAEVLQSAEWLEQDSYADRFDEVLGDTVLPVLDDLASRLILRGHYAVVFREPRGLYQNLSIREGSAELVFRSRDSIRTQQADMDLPLEFQGRAWRQWGGDGTPHFWIHGVPWERLIVFTEGNGGTWTGKGSWPLEEITSELVRGEAVRFIEEALTRITVPTPPGPPRGYLKRGRVTPRASGELQETIPIRRAEAATGERTGPVKVLSIKATAELGEQIQLSVELEDLTFGGGPNPDRPGRLHDVPPAQASRFTHHFTSHLMRALAIDGVSSRHGSTISFSVRRDELEDTVRAIPLVVAEFNESYPTLLAEHEHEIERRRGEEAAEQRRLEADQQVIDRLTSET